MRTNDPPRAVADGTALETTQLRESIQRMEALLAEMHSAVVPVGPDSAGEPDVRPLLEAIHAFLGNATWTLRDCFDQVRRDATHLPALREALHMLGGSLDEAAARRLGQLLPKACGRLVGDLVLRDVGRDPKLGRVFMIEYRPRQVPKRAVG